MFGDRIVVVLARIGAYCLLGLIAGCGGGGSNNANPPVTGTFSATFSPAALDTYSIEGNTVQVSFTAAMTYTGQSTIYLVAESDASVIAVLDGSVLGDTLQVFATLRGDLAPGTYSTQVRLHACNDEQCLSEVAGSPVALSINYVVKPNLKVQQVVQLHRAGQEPAPAVVIPVTVPAEAGIVQISGTGATDAIDATFDGSALHLNTRQVRAGQYNLNLILQGSSDPRYTQSVNVQYTVDPPPGGEHGLSVDPGRLDLYLPQGITKTQRLVATRPTWTDVWQAPQIMVGSEFIRLLDVGNDQYDLTIDTTNLPLQPPGTYNGSIQFSAGPTGGTQIVSVSLQVEPAFYPTGNFVVSLGASSTSSDLGISSPIVTVDGAAAHWSATSRTSWLHVLRNVGTTGIDTLELQIDPGFSGATDWGLVGMIDLSVDRAGTLPLPVQVSVWNYLPALKRSEAVLVGDAGRIYVEGALNSLYSGLINSGALQVEGADLVSAQFRTDGRFLGDYSVLALDISGAVAGQPITVHARTPLLVSQVSIAVQAPARVPQAYVSLPYGNYRPSGYAPGLDAYYFSGPDTVFRWIHSGAAWTMAQAIVPGVSAVALRQDEQTLYAACGTTLRALDPVALSPVGSGELHTLGTTATIAQFDGAVPPSMAGMAYASDGRAMASVAETQSGQRVSRGAHWIATSSQTRDLAELSASPIFADPGTGGWSYDQLQTGVGLVASARGHTIVGTDPTGHVEVYQSNQRSWAYGQPVPANTTIVAVSDSGDRMIRSDGVVIELGSALGNLTSLLPSTHFAGGFGLTQDGRYALVYGYRVAIENGAQRARDAAIWVVDMAQVPATSLTSAPVVAVVQMDDAVGCTAVLATGESCLHMASVTAAAGGASAFVLGPRGVAAVALPSTVAVATGADRRVQVLSKSRSAPVSKSVTRVIGVMGTAP